MFFAEKVARQYRGTPFEADLASAVQKIHELMSEQVSVSPETLDSFLSLDVGPTYMADAKIFADVLSSLRLRRTALIRYRSLSSGRTTNRRVRPYHVFNHRGDWYVAAWDEKRGEVRDFALHRIRRVTRTTESYTIPKEFDFKKYMADAFAIEGRPPGGGRRAPGSTRSGSDPHGCAPAHAGPDDRRSRWTPGGHPTARPAPRPPLPIGC